MFTELLEGQTHSENDGCREPAHNRLKNLETILKEFDEKFGKCSLLYGDRMELTAMADMSGVKQFLKSSIQTALEAVRLDFKKEMEEFEMIMPDGSFKDCLVYHEVTGKALQERLVTNIRNFMGEEGKV